jgi:hypothetical protein
MTLHQQIGQLQHEARILARNLELADRLAETCGHPQQNMGLEFAGVIRAKLRAIYTRLHHLESRLPTADTLSQAAYNRALMLGFTLEAAEVERVTTYRHALMDRTRAA